MYLSKFSGDDSNILDPPSTLVYIRIWAPRSSIPSHPRDNATRRVNFAISLSVHVVGHSHIRISKPFSIRSTQPSAPNHNHKFWTNSLPTLNFTHHTDSHLITTFSTVSHSSHDAPEENVMSTPSSTSNLAPLQPPNLYHLSPTYQKWCALRCADIITLKDRRVYVEGFFPLPTPLPPSPPPPHPSPPQSPRRPTIARARQRRPSS